jgi:elongation factor G
MGRALGILPAVETTAIVVNGQTGIELVTQRMMEFAAARKLCRLIIVNKIDADGIDLERVVGDVRKTFGAQCLPLNLPARAGQAVADCFFEPADETPDFSTVEAAHTEITEQVIELDDELMDLYLEQGEDISLEQLHDPFERALRRGHLIPVCFVSAQTGAGLRQLLRVFSQLMPSPLEANPPEFYSLNGGEKPFKIDPADASRRFVGHAFKVNVDPYVGRLVSFRVHQGEIRAGSSVFVGDKRKAVRLAHLYRTQGKELEEIPSASAGDICAVSKIDDIKFDDVLHSSHDEDEIRMRPVAIPPPMHGVALELKQRGQ